jgi:hypothetical protein
MNEQNLISSVKGYKKVNCYDWDKNNNFENQLVQIYYKTCRNSNPVYLDKFGKIFQQLYLDKNFVELNKLIQLVCHIRDIEEGKGEYELSYALLVNIFLYTKNHQLIIDVMKHFVDSNLFKNKSNKHSYGSWKDIKYFCDYLQKNAPVFCINETDKNLIINGMVSLHIEQIKDDLVNYDLNQTISLAAKWVPREKSKFSWLYITYLEQFFKKEDKSPNLKLGNSYNYFASKFRKSVSLLNKYLKTPQIFLCCKEWKNLDFDNVSGITINKQYKAFMNINRNKNKELEQSHRDDEDRKKCKINFMEFMNLVKIGEKSINARQINLGQLVGDGFEAIMKNDTDMKFVINTMFNEYVNQINIPNNYLVISDNSSSIRLDKESYNNLLGLSIVLAHNCKYGKRIMAFGNRSAWINLDGKNTLCDYLETIKSYEFHRGSNIGYTLDLLIESFNNHNIPLEEIQKMKLFILSDMQVENEEGLLNTTLMMLIKSKFTELSLSKSKNKNDIITPQLIFWNFNNYSGFPSLYNLENSIMISGYNLNLISKCVSSSFVHFTFWTPYDFLENILNKERYDFCFTKSIKKIQTKKQHM